MAARHTSMSPTTWAGGWPPTRASPRRSAGEHLRWRGPGRPAPRRSLLGRPNSHPTSRVPGGVGEWRVARAAGRIRGSRCRRVASPIRRPDQRRCPARECRQRSAAARSGRCRRRRAAAGGARSVGQAGSSARPGTACSAAFSKAATTCGPARSSAATWSASTYRRVASASRAAGSC